MKECIKRDIKKDKDYFIIQMGIGLKENGKMIKRMVKELCFIKVEGKKKE